MVLQEKVIDDRLQLAPKVPVVLSAELPGTELEARCLAILKRLENQCSPISQ